MRPFPCNIQQNSYNIHDGLDYGLWTLFAGTNDVYKSTAQYQRS